MDKEAQHDALLAAAVEAHESYIEAVSRMKRARVVAFKKAVSSTVTAREIAKATGLNERQVGRIKDGQA